MTGAADAGFGRRPASRGADAVASARPDRHPAGGELTRFDGRAMASPLRLLVGGVSAAVTAQAWVAVVAEFEAAEQALSRFRETSDVTRLNRRTAAGDRRPLAVDRRLAVALVAADRARRLTRGQFDPRILADLERIGDHGAAIAPIGGDARARPTGRLVRWSGPTSVGVERPVDLGGIGKGLALRWAAARVSAIVGPDGSFLVDAGGDIVVGGPAPGSGWQVGIEDPAGGGTPAAILDLVAGAVATSSVRRRSWLDSDGTPVHHLLDPATGRPGGPGLLAVTVAGPDPAWAEVRSKALFLGGARSIRREAAGLGVAAWWIDAAGELAMTERARRQTTWLRRDAEPAAAGG